MLKKLKTFFFNSITGILREMLVPDAVSVPLVVFEQFYFCFLAQGPTEREDLCAAAGRLTEVDLENVANELVGQLKESKTLSATGVKAIAKELLNALHRAGQMNTRESPEERFRSTLSKYASLGTELPQVNVSPVKRDVPRVPGHELLSVLGEGGAGCVFFARHVATNQPRAIKIIDDVKQSRFELEIATLRDVRHENLVNYFESGRLTANSYWIAMEFVGAKNLAECAGCNRINAETAINYATQILRGLSALHSRSIVHRDLTPRNVMVGHGDRIKLIDFGLAKHLLNSPDVASVGATGKTKTGALLGTPYYISPEQARGDKVSTQTDIWSFGIILYELFVGKLPYTATTILALGNQILVADIDCDHEDIPAELRPVLKRCLTRDPGLRFSNAEETLSAFRKPASTASDRLRFERFKPSWIAVIDQGLLEQFALLMKGALCETTDAEFCEFAQSNGVSTLDFERVSQILPPIFAQQRRLVELDDQVLEAERTIAEIQQSPRLCHLADAQEVVVAELRAARLTNDSIVRDEVRRQLAGETSSWEELRRQTTEREATFHAQRRAEAESLRKSEAEVSRRADTKTRNTSSRNPMVYLKTMAFLQLLWLLIFGSVCFLAYKGLTTPFETAAALISAIFFGIMARGAARDIETDGSDAVQSCLIATIIGCVTAAISVGLQFFLRQLFLWQS